MFEFYHIETFVKESDSFWISLLITIIGTLIGFLGAFYLSKLTDRKQTNKEKQQKIDNYKDRLRYLSQLIEISINILYEQLNNFEELAEEITNEPTEQHLLKTLASNDLQRLQNMDTEEVFHAYHLIILNHENKLKDYKNIYSCIDFLYLRLKQAIESCEKKVQFTYRDQMNIKENIENLSNLIYKNFHKLKKIGQTDTVDYQFLEESYLQIMELFNNKSKIGDYETEFIIEFGNELIKKYKDNVFFDDLYDLTTKIVIKFNHMKVNATTYAAELRDLRMEMKKSIDLLLNINEKIKSNTER